ncbi:glucosylglycerol-phosphate synthase/alpha,alpha-trehalose-phosphate synthase [UDP-forming],TIGR02400 [Chitinophaga skermanii]|uniref:Glucosylglycerol-phosphate synthase n=1 Tax=Chitinophaga skermanii TaxID=331697 RepID=A0A327R610_9BACT|nr:glucosylglycerol-phosphate synthase [Chitinophaga skermanii]RAJ11124.1 glucosylglycerol-phosphate synthase/alpha,alpha-trehalose-phosphate synthase [UDP-forming],TIGR02400 [Chitinophaga skermanii]
MILATDLDGTFLGGDQQSKNQLYSLIRDNKDFRLIFVTGRGLESVLPLLSDPVIPRPDYIICDVGATVLNGYTLEPVQPIQNSIEEKWPGRQVIHEQMDQIPGLRFQQVPQQRRCSYFFDDESIKYQVEQLEAQLGCDIILSAGKFLDVMPPNVNKGSTLKQLIHLLQVPANEVLVAGDTLNDLSLYNCGYKGVVVGEAEPALLNATAELDHVYQAIAPGAGGIMEAMQQFPAFASFVKAQHIPLAVNENVDTQLVMLYHRFPFESREVNGKMERVAPKSPNGIIPTLTNFFKTGRPGTWIAWEETKDKKAKAENFFIDEENYPNLQASPVLLGQRDVEVFYKLFSKEAFWPAIFSFIEKVQFNHTHWEHYLKINRLFAEKAAAEAEPGATVWVHDYNLWMVPGYLRQLRPDVKIGFFHHTSFPAANTFNVIPWRAEIIGSLLQCDYISFHIPRYVENFVDVVRSLMNVKIVEQVNCAPRFLTYSCAMGIGKMTTEIQTGQRTVRLGANPVGVHVDYISELTQKESVQQLAKELRAQTSGKKIILSVERLDYVKGPLEKIRAFGQFLEEYPEFHGKVELINICTPPSSGMKIYESVQRELEQAIGKINGKYSRLDWVPIHFFFRALPFEDVVAYYAMADVCWITPLRDGLNLVAKEYVAVQGQDPNATGVLVLSEFAGASVELAHAVLTNPYDKKSMKESLLKALVMDEQERKIRMQRLYQTVSTYTIHYWAEEFMEALEKVEVLVETEA